MLKSFYQRYQSRNPTERLTRISRFRPKHVGKSDDRCLKTKAAETWGFLLFIESFLSDRHHQLDDGQRLLSAVRALIDLVMGWKRAGANLNVMEVQRSFDSWTEFLALTQDYPCMHIPKRHLVSHLLMASQRLGNPGRYANWHDEGLNSKLRSCARFAAQVNFEATVMLRMRRILHKTQERGVKRRHS